MSLSEKLWQENDEIPQVSMTQYTKLYNHFKTELFITFKNNNLAMLGGHACIV
jgi:hypothetical protein